LTQATKPDSVISDGEKPAFYCATSHASASAGS